MTKGGEFRGSNTPEPLLPRVVGLYVEEGFGGAAGGGVFVGERFGGDEFGVGDGPALLTPYLFKSMLF
jgi:hypothetical protein